MTERPPDYHKKDLAIQAYIDNQIAENRKERDRLKARKKEEYARNYAKFDLFQGGTTYDPYAATKAERKVEALRLKMDAQQLKEMAEDARAEAEKAKANIVKQPTDKEYDILTQKEIDKRIAESKAYAAQKAAKAADLEAKYLQVLAQANRTDRYAYYDLAASQYEVYFGKELMPIAPAEIKTSIESNDETFQLVTGQGFIIPEMPKLTKMTFTLWLPAHPYPWAQYRGGFKKPVYYLNLFEKLKVACKPFDFAVIRNHDKSTNSDTYMKMVISDYVINEDADGLVDDIEVDISLLQFNDLVSTSVKLATKDGKPVATTDKTRPGGPDRPKTYTVKYGDTLCELAKKYLGDSGKWKDIYDLNKSKIQDYNRVPAGTVLRFE
ncbi:LysM peptidoglycan-binding domain-containing protein [Peptococcus simiae]|uniref:LysM peptidoglycan-binding domain-containing protein n=1 Tax=Peptococcus simiae TaxID=1643805 RepID=UPI0039809E9B